MKKYLIPISVSIAVAVIAVVYFVFFKGTSVYSAIPNSAFAVIEIKDWAKQEMSYYLFSKPDEFPGKELEEAKNEEGIQPKEDKHSKIKEALKAALKKESIYKDNKGNTVVANSTQSDMELRKQGYRVLPGTTDATGISKK